MIQSVRQTNPDRTDHVWYKKDGGKCKCCLCGALADNPPQYPTPGDWLPDGYEKLTDLEKTLCRLKK